MSEGESGADPIRMQVILVGDKVLWRWTAGEVSVSLSLPNADPMSDEVYRDVQYLVYGLPDLVTTGTVEAQVQLFKQEMEEGGLDEVTGESG